MEIELKTQVSALLLSLFMGLGIALVYDLLRPLRHRAGKTGAALLDALFCVLAFIFAFSFAMGAGEGRLGQWELFGMLLGFLAYMHLLSEIFSGIFELWTELILSILKNLKNFIKKSVVSAKFIFKNMRK